MASDNTLQRGRGRTWSARLGVVQLLALSFLVIVLAELGIMTAFRLLDLPAQNRWVLDVADPLLLGMIVAPTFVLVALAVHRRLVRMEMENAGARRQAESVALQLADLKAALDEHALFAVTDPSGIIIDVNDRFCRTSQYTREELIGRTHRVINSGLHPKDFWVAMWRTIASGRAWHGEVCNRKKDGSLYWVDTTIMPIRDAAGSIVRHVAIRAEITDRKLAEARLMESQLLLRTVIDVLPQRVFWKDKDSRYLGANAPMLRDAGEQDVVGKTDFDMPWKHEEAEFFRECDARVMRSGVPELNIVETMRRVDGSEIILRTNKVPLVNSTGNVIGVLGTYEDVTTFYRAKRDLAEERARLAAFVEYAPAAIAMLDRDVRYVAASRRWNTEFGLEAGEDLRGRSHYEVFPNISENWRDVHRRALAGEVVRSNDDCWRPPGWSRDQYLRWEVRPWHDGDGHVCGIMMFVEDVTPQREKERELERLRDEAEAASRAKSEFLANMSHEIRTPLTAILGYADLLEDADRDGATGGPSRRELVDTIQRAGSHLVALVNDILDLSKIEAGALRVQDVSTDVTEMLRSVERLLRPRAAEKNVDLALRVRGSIPRRIMTDPTRLRQILLNLAGNAVKFTDHGGVALEVRCDGATESDQRFVVDVEDTGDGISEGAQEALFKPFTQADTSLTRRFGGCGLGLAICRRLAGLMGGRVELVRSAPGVGSVFRLTLPLRIPDEGAEWVEEIPEEQPGASVADSTRVQGRVLLAEDGPDNQRLIAMILRKAGARVEVVNNGREALAAIDAAAAQREPYDLIVTDIQMPEMDGHTLARELRTRGSAVPILALTAHAMIEDRQRCLDAGCNDYATKPVDRARLVAQCASLLRCRSPLGSATLATPRSS